MGRCLNRKLAFILFYLSFILSPIYIYSSIIYTQENLNSFDPDIAVVLGSGTAGISEIGINSFPSGHTTYAMVICGCIFFLAPRVVKWPVVARIVQVLSAWSIALMGISRVFMEAHWPSDVLGGLILGGLILAPGIFIYKQYIEGDQTESEVENARAP